MATATGTAMRKRQVQLQLRWPSPNAADFILISASATPSLNSSSGRVISSRTRRRWVANQPGEKYNPLFIYGGVGLGKTHLATAIGHYLWASQTRPRKVLSMSAEVFMNELIGSLRRDRMGEFKEKFRRVDTLILDDVQFLADRE